MENNDINIEGMGTINQGTYKNIHIEGMGTIQGDIIAENVEIDGKVKALGKINCKEMNTNGFFKVFDDINVEENCEVDGYLKSTGSINGKYLEVNGRIDVEKKINFDKAEINGELIVLEDCQCGELRLDGRVKIEGLLSGDKLDLNISRFNEIKEIGGEKVTVKKSRNPLKVLLFSKGRNAKLICEEIEADEIYLENTFCKVVRGKNIEIGPGCNIKRIEYTETLKESGKSKINEKINI